MCGGRGEKKGNNPKGKSQQKILRFSVATQEHWIINKLNTSCSNMILIEVKVLKITWKAEIKSSKGKARFRNNIQITSDPTARISANIYT